MNILSTRQSERTSRRTSLLSTNDLKRLEFFLSERKKRELRIAAKNPSSYRSMNRDEIYSSIRSVCFLFLFDSVLSESPLAKKIRRNHSEQFTARVFFSFFIQTYNFVVKRHRTRSATARSASFLSDRRSSGNLL